MRSITLAALLLASTALAEPPPAGGGPGIFTPAGPYNLATGRLYGDQANDSNTYIWRSGADEWTVTSGGVNVLVCDELGCSATGAVTVSGLLTCNGGQSGCSSPSIGDGATTATGDVLMGAYAIQGGIDNKGANGELHACAWATTTLTFAANPGDASKTASALIPAGSVLHAVATRVLVAGTNCTSVSIGDGVDTDLWGTTIAVALATTTNNASATAQWSNPQLTAGDVVITANGGNCFGYSARVSALYCTTTAPTN